MRLTMDSRNLSLDSKPCWKESWDYKPLARDKRAVPLESQCNMWVSCVSAVWARERVVVCPWLGASAQGCNRDGPDVMHPQVVTVVAH